LAGQHLHDTAELLRVVELLVHGREAHIGNGVDLQQFLHHHAPDFDAADFRLVAILDFVLDGIDGFSRTSMLTGRFRQATTIPCRILLRSNGSRRPSFLTTISGAFLVALEGGVAFAAAEAFASPANNRSAL
jgi:hypothetical protein